MDTLLCDLIAHRQCMKYAHKVQIQKIIKELRQSKKTNIKDLDHSNEDEGVSTKVGNYVVTENNSMYTCTCKHFIYRIGESVEKRDGCKHILQVT